MLLVLENDVPVSLLAKLSLRRKRRWSGCAQSVNNARDVTQDCEEQVDEKVGAATTLEEDSEWWKEDGENDLDNVARVSSQYAVRVRISAAFVDARAHPAQMSWKAGKKKLLPSGERHDGGRSVVVGCCLLCWY